LQHYANDRGLDDLRIVGKPGMARLTYTIRDHATKLLTDSGTCKLNRQPGQNKETFTNVQPIERQNETLSQVQPFPKPAENAPTTNKEGRLDIPTISRKANGAVVSIIMSDSNGHPITQGSGFLISKDGQVVTNYHVIREGVSAIVKLPNGASFHVDGVLASDKNRDVAVIKVHGNAFRTLNLGDSDRLQVGEEVVAIGNPLSLESTVSNGIVSAVRTIKAEGGTFLQTTAPISPGSSGGPLFNMVGEVVGITTSNLVGGQNLNFAIPINDAKDTIWRATLRLSDVNALPDELETETVTPE